MDLICFSHLRWNFVYQRPQHLLSRFAKTYRVFYVEEPVYENDVKHHLQFKKAQNNLWVVTPVLQPGLSIKESNAVQHKLLKEMFEEYNLNLNIFWYYTPMALAFTNNFTPEMLVYDCMDELANFKFAPAGLKEYEAELFAKADVVFTGGHNLYKAKMKAHHNIFPVPSSIDKSHFVKARRNVELPADQENIPLVRMGYYGVIDERMDIDLIKNVALKNPSWHFVMIGPVIKIDPASLPQLPNIHFLGNKSYEELPAYLSGWQIAIIPFLLNDATKYISPTKTPEYLSAGVPVISTPIADVVNPYGENNLVEIVNDEDEFTKAAKKILKNSSKEKWLNKVDAFLANNSWDNSFDFIMQELTKTKNKKGRTGQIRFINNSTSTVSIHV